MHPAARSNILTGNLVALLMDNGAPFYDIVQRHRLFDVLSR